MPWPKSSARVLLAALAATALSGAPAQAAPQGWKVHTKTHLRGYDWLSGVVAPSKNSAWAYGARVERHTAKPIVLRWDGRKWRPDAKGLTSPIISLDASSPGAVWGLVSTAPQDYYRADPCQRRRAPEGVRVVHRTGGRWTAGRTFPGLEPVGFAVRGPRDVWLFGRDFTWHYTGHWKRTKTPFQLTDVDYAPGAGFWATAVKENSDGRARYLVARFDGKRWRETVKGLPTAPASKDGDTDETAEFSGISVLGPRQVFVKTEHGTPTCGGQVYDRGYFRWNGRVWSRENGPARSWDLGRLVPDGRGGAYSMAYTYSDDYTSYYTLWHRSAGGAWTKRGVRREGVKNVAGIAHVPGRTGIWLVGTTCGWDCDGTIYTHGEVR